MNVTIIGCGAFALGMTNLLKEKNRVTMWVHDEKEIVKLEEQIKINYMTNLNDSIKNAEVIFILVSSPFFKNIIDKLEIIKNIPVYIGTKGMLEDEFLLSYTKRKLKQEEIYFFAGPNLASDLKNNNPTGFTLTNNDNNLLKKLMPNYVIIDKEYESHLEFYSIFKNIIAIGSGIIYEITKSYSSVATYLTKAFQELKNPKILYGTIGDYFMTGTSVNSRNFTYGTYIANNRNKASDFLKNNTVEGYIMLEILYNYLKNKKYELKIITLLYSIIYQNRNENLLLEYLK